MTISPLVLKLGMVRFATSLLVVLLTSVLNRVLIVELLVPAALVTFCFAFQHVMTPTGLIAGFFSDKRLLWGWRRLPYILGGMILSLIAMPFFPLWARGLAAAPHSMLVLYQGIGLFSLFGIGTTVSATAVNAVLVDQIPEVERGSALTLVWIMTLGGFIVGSTLLQYLLPLYDPARLDEVFGVVTVVALGITIWGTRGVEHRGFWAPSRPPGRLHLGPTLRLLGSNVQAVIFFGFLAASVFFMAIQTFILTAYGGEVLGLPVAESTKFGIYTSYGILFGMVGVQILLRHWKNLTDKTIISFSLIFGSLAFALLSLTSLWPHPTLGIYSLLFLGLSRGMYNVGISHLTMSLAPLAFSGIFMGLWNLVSGLALAGGEMAGGFLIDQSFHLVGDLRWTYGLVFMLESLGILSCLLLLAPLNRDKYWGRFKILVARRFTPSYNLEEIANLEKNPEDQR